MLADVLGHAFADCSVALQQALRIVAMVAQNQTSFTALVAVVHHRCSAATSTIPSVVAAHSKFVKANGTFVVLLLELRFRIDRVLIFFESIVRAISTQRIQTIFLLAVDLKIKRVFDFPASFCFA